MEKKFIAVPEDLLNRIDSLISCMWARGGLDKDFKFKECFEFNKVVGDLRNFIKGKQHEVCSVCGDFIIGDHKH